MDSNTLRNLIEQSSNIAIITHINPDGDAIGSAIAMATVAERGFNKNVRIFTPNRTAHYLTSIDGFEYVTDFLSDPKNSVRYIKDADLIICVDFNDYNTRIGEVSQHIVNNKKAKKINFDHHMSPDRSLYDLAFCDEKNCSAANVILQALRDNGFDEMIDKRAAEALYTGMMTDTGNFSYGHLTEQLYMNIAFLIQKGVDPADINNRIFNVKQERALRLTSFAISQKMIVDYKTQSAVISLTKSELKQFGYESGDCEGLVNVPLSIEGVYNSALFMEQDGYIKVSLRSQKDLGIDTNLFARKYFNGGGHINASGGKAFKMTTKECEETLFNNIIDFQ